MVWILAHPIQSIMLYWVFSAVVSGMPDPTSSSSVTYTWAHRSLHILAGNLTSAVQSRYASLLPPPSSGDKTITTVGILTEKTQTIPNNGK